MHRTFTHVVTAQPEDMDPLGHVFNLVYLRWALDAALAHSTAVGWDWDAYRRIGGVFVVRRHEIEYLRPAVAGDLIQVVTWVETMQAASSLRRFRIVRARDGVELARAATLWAFLDLATGRPRRVPAAVRAAFPLRPPAAAGTHDEGQGDR